MNAPMRELLEWVDREPRAYSETVDVWRTSCPRLSIWEDALADGLIEVVRSEAGSNVVLTSVGRAALVGA